MGRKYKTVNISNYNSKNVYDKARENMKKKRKEALNIINKSKVINLEIKILCAMLAIIIIMFAMSTFIIAWNNKKTRGTNGVKNETLNVKTEDNINTQYTGSNNMGVNNMGVNNMGVNNMGINKLINDAGNILSDINHTEIFH